MLPKDPTASKILLPGEMGKVVLGADVRCNVGVVKVGLVRMVGWGVVDPELGALGPRIYPMTAKDAINLANALMRAAHDAMNP